MSAFLFVMKIERIEKMTDQELSENLFIQKKIVNEFNWSKYQQCSFDSDQASGCKANVDMIEQEIERRRNGSNDKIRKPLVPGYNPGEE